MAWARLHHGVRECVRWLQRFADRFWYPPLVGLLAGLDNFVVIVPTDGILISSSMLTPRRWFLLAFSVALGSTLGALVLAALVEYRGLPWILEMYPWIEQSKTWVWSQDFFDQYGLFLVFMVAVTPFMQQPAIILAALANTPLYDLAIVVFVGRLIKYMIMAYVGSHTPRLLKKMWGLKGELEDVGLK